MKFLQSFVLGLISFGELKNGEKKKKREVKKKKKMLRKRSEKLEKKKSLQYVCQQKVITKVVLL